MRRIRLLWVSLSLAGLVGMLGSTTIGNAPSATAAVGGPIQFGAAQAAYPGASKIQAIQNLDSVAGRQLAVIRVYNLWTDAFPDSTANWLKSTNRTMFMSIKTKRPDGSHVMWADIARATPGTPLYADMLRWAKAIKAFGAPVYLSFNHEPETSVSQPSGSPAEYIQAWRTFVGVFRAQGVTNARFAWTTAVRNYSAAPTSSKYAPRYYPGDEWVEYLAIDAYNMYCMKKDGTFSMPWRSLETLLAPFMQFATQHQSEGLIVAEYGTPEDPAQPSRKAEWIDAARLMFQQSAFARFEAVMYWNQLSHNFAGCDFRVTSSTAARNAFVKMANDPYYSGAPGAR